MLRISLTVILAFALFNRRRRRAGEARECGRLLKAIDEGFVQVFEKWRRPW